jgi:TldD protein
MQVKQLCDHALNAAVSAGADYADVRIIERRRQAIATRNSTLSTLDQSHSFGFGVRVLAEGAWGFASAPGTDRDDLQRVAREAAAVARASARVSTQPVRLSEAPVVEDRWFAPCTVHPWSVPLDQKIGLLLEVDAVLRKQPKIAIAHAAMEFVEERKWFASTEGSFIDQSRVRSGAGYSATAVDAGQVQIRSYPASHGGNAAIAGYELIGALELVANAERVREQALALLTAPPCPDTTTDLVLGTSQMALQIHESCGHATELDRALGMEESFAGSSFLTPDKLGRYRYGSEIVNLVADNTIAGGLATWGYDDDGIPGQRWPIIQQGIFRAYGSSRELAGEIGRARSTGCSRAADYESIPIIRQPNLFLLPGEGSLVELLESTDRGVYMDTNRSWSIDQMRLNFQFGCEIGWEIKGGKLGRMVRNPSYQGITPQFWGACDRICGAPEFQLWGVANCGKGEPMQTNQMSHGAPPTRFRDVRVFPGR